MGDLQQIRLLKDPRNLSLFLKIMLGIAFFRVLIFWMKLPSLLESLDRYEVDAKRVKSDLLEILEDLVKEDLAKSDG